MKNYLLLTLFLSLSLFGFADEEYKINYNIKGVNLDASNIHPMLVVTNRVLDVDNTTNEVHLSHEIDTSDVKYLIVTSNKANPKVKIYSTFHEAFSKIKHNNLVMHVHGFGQDFNATLRSGITLQKNYDINLILFDVPTETVSFNIFSEFKRSKKYFKQSTKNFDDFLNDYEVSAKYYNVNDKPILFLHSLGNYLLEEYIQSGTYDYNEKLAVFENILINAPAVKKKHHAEWIEKIDEDINVYITINKKDFTLKGAEFITMTRQLGSSKIKQKHLASNASYLTFHTLAGSEHNYFINPMMMANDQIKSFYDQVLEGHSIVDENYINNEEGIDLIVQN
ncbi:alpha/beta hydrolase [Flammeovirga aprica]|uniref:Alpha/beta hydrolase n=1 Tax=Flammeovirga aprica JL-4 TaxID=694437 RepID=A0A7X9RQ90_9BACT|nr:alpha/beta hydrolase [Flammeovirga aprica]NME66528.1 alpha/beta hydrolase [Flammeovirga aprica JL-4]